MDGTSSIFRAYSKERGQVSWDAWSPQSKSLGDRLSAVALALGQFCKTGSKIELEAALIELDKTNP